MKIAMKISSVLAILSLVVTCVASAAGRVSVSGGLEITGSSTILPIAESIGKLYQEKYHEPIRIKGGGSAAGIENALSGAADIGLVSRAVKSGEKAKLNYATIGHDAVVIIVNSSNPVEEISKSALVALYGGTVRNWKEIGGRDEPVLLVSKRPGRSTLEIFEEYTGLKHISRSERGESGFISKSVYEIGSNLEGAAFVGGLPGALGYMSKGTALSLIRKGMPLKILRLEGIEPTKENMMSGRYPMWRVLNLVFRRDNQKVKRFVDLFLGPEGQRILSEHGFIPAEEERRFETIGKN